MKWFGREPTVWLSGITGILGLLVTFRWEALSADQAAAIVAALTAVVGAVNAALVRPIAPAAFTYAVTALATALAAYGLDFGAEKVGAVQVIVLWLLTLLTRAQVTPTSDPRGTGTPTTADPITADGVRGLVR